MGLSTGRLTADWTNHFDRTFSRLTPFVELGVGNTIVDSRLFYRPFTSLGFNAHIQRGAAFALRKHVSLGASVYGILPSGEQKIYSKLVNPQTASSMTSSSTQYGRVFENANQTTGTADIARDHGFSTWVGASPNDYVDFQLGFTHSVNYDLNTISFNVGINVGHLLRQKKRR